MEKNYYHTLVIGSGCAGFNAADWLYDLNVRDIAIITEGVNMGTSRNTGSDKQTYYKLTLSGNEPDSVYDMAEALFNGGGVHGDIALAEAAGSVKSFMKLVNLGVPFPCDEYGAYVGYQTDHDKRRRATSCGPLTSKLMTEALERSVNKKEIPILDGRQVIKLLVSNGHIRGLAAINKNADFSYETFYCENIILATGGPAGVYANVVYPESQTGGTGLALDAGAKAYNLQEWQYGLASVDFRWNVSGAYQQVLPKYISVSPDGVAREFLPEYFKSPRQALNMVFLKGYQWPFDVRKIDGSSSIDRIISDEINIKGNKVYMDFRGNPAGLENGFDTLSEEARNYLEKSGVSAFDTPIQRLAKMNPKAIELYRDNGIDLYSRPLRVAVCAQHCNGGIAVDTNWQSTVQGLYVAGEAAGTFGIYRPGGSALNSGQVGSMRAAEHIEYKIRKGEQAKEHTNTTAVFIPPAVIKKSGGSTLGLHKETQKQMSRHAAYVRSIDEMKHLYAELLKRRRSFFTDNAASSKKDLPFLYKAYDILLTQAAVLSAMLLSADEFGSRGGGLVKGKENRFQTDKIVATQADVSAIETARPIPVCDGWFENVWNEYNERKK